MSILSMYLHAHEYRNSHGGQWTTFTLFEAGYLEITTVYTQLAAILPSLPSCHRNAGTA